MNLIDAIPIGKKYKISKEDLMEKAKIRDIRTFRKELKKLHEQYVILYDDGYYLPASKEEYLEFIVKLEGRISEIENILLLVYKEMEEKDYV